MSANHFVPSPICNTFIIQKQSFSYYQGLLLLVSYRFDICAQFLKRKTIPSNTYKELEEFIFPIPSFKKRYQEYALSIYGNAKQLYSYLFDKLNNFNTPTSEHEKMDPQKLEQVFISLQTLELEWYKAL